MNDNIYKDAIETFGIECQFIVAFEELAELQKELSKHIRGNNNIDKIAEEIADVEIMIEQLKIYFNIYEEVSEHKAGKLIRLSERIEDARGGRIKAISEKPDVGISKEPKPILIHAEKPKRNLVRIDIRKRKEDRLGRTIKKFDEQLERIGKMNG